MFAKLYSLKNHQGFVKYFKNTSWMMAEQFLRIVSGLFIGIWVARYLGPNQYGLFSYVLAFTAIFGSIAKLGLEGIVMRELNNFPEKRDIYLGTAFWLKVSSALVVIALLAVIVPFSSNDSQTSLSIFIIAGGFLFNSFEVIEFYFQSQVNAKIVSICKTAQLLLSSIIKIYLVFAEAELIYFVLVSAFDSLSLAFSYYVAYRINQKTSFYKHFDLNVAKQLLKESWPLIFSMLFIVLYMKTDQVMIGNMLGDKEVGIYTAGIKFVQLPMLLPTLIVTSLFPAILSLKEKGGMIYKRRLQYLFSMMIYISLPLLLIFSFFSDVIIAQTFGEGYKLSANVLSLYCFALPFMFLAVASSRWFVAEKLQRLLFYRAMLGAAINIILNLALIPLIGINGAALSTIGCYIFVAFIFDFLNPKTRYIGFIKIKSVSLSWMVRQS